MRRHISFREYRTIDLAIFAVMTVIFEGLIIVASNYWFRDQLYTVSLAAAMTAIVYMRWGIFGAFTAVLSGFVFCLFYEGTLSQYIIYMAGNLCSLPALVYLNKLGKERVRKSSFLTVVFGLTVILLMQLGRTCVAILLGTDPDIATGFIYTDALSIVFTLVIVWIVRRIDGLFEDQKHYILRIREEEENEHS